MTTEQSVTTDNRCEQSDLLVEHCAHCRGLDDLPNGSEVLYSFAAKFNSYCDRCDAEVREGDQLFRLGDNSLLCGRCAK